MDEELIVMLRIEEGIGFSKTTHDNIIAVASLSGNQMESDIIPAATTTSVFNSNLIWETDRASVKRMKQENLPVRLECYAVNLKDSANKRSLIGHILLPIRSVVVQTISKGFNVTPHWHKLIGLAPEWKDMKPQILLFVAITNRENLVGNVVEEQKDGGGVEVIEMPSSSSSSAPTTPEEFTTIDSHRLLKHDFNIKIHQDYIQIGQSDKHTDLFNFTINFIKLSNLNKLIREDDPLNQNYWLEFHLLDLDDKKRTIPLTNTEFRIDKKVELKLRSSKEILELFFERVFEVEVAVGYAETVLGKCRIKSIDGLKTEEKVCRIECPGRGVCELSYEVNASIELPQTIPTKIPTPRKIKVIPAEKPKLSVTFHQDKIRHTYSLTFVLISVKFQRKPDAGTWQLSLQHSKAETQFTMVNIEMNNISDCSVEFLNTSLVLYFSSPIDDISKLIDADTLVLVISGPRNLSARADLDGLKMLNSTSDQSLGIALLENTNGENIALAHLYIQLKDMGENFNSQLKRGRPELVSKPYFDEKYAYKVVEELEDWKSQQQEEFTRELRDKETAFMEKLAREWFKKRLDEESRLADRIEQCKKLTQALEEAHHKLKPSALTPRHSHRRSVPKVPQLNSLQDTHHNHHHSEFEHKLKLEELRYKELEMSNSFTVQENSMLRERVSELENKIDELNLQAHPKHEVAALYQEIHKLNDRLNSEVESKNFYKEKWAKLLRQVHKMNRENSINLEPFTHRTSYFDEEIDHHHHHSPHCDILHHIPFD